MLCAGDGRGWFGGSRNHLPISNWEFLFSRRLSGKAPREEADLIRKKKWKHRIYSNKFDNENFQKNNKQWIILVLSTSGQTSWFHHSSFLLSRWRRRSILLVAWCDLSFHRRHGDLSKKETWWPCDYSTPLESISPSYIIRIIREKKVPSSPGMFRKRK